MSNTINFKTTDFLKLMLASFDHNSSSNNKAKEYLNAEGINPDLILDEGLKNIKRLQEQLEKSRKINNIISQAKTINNDASSSTKKIWSHKSVKTLILESGNPDPLDEIRKRVRNLVVKAFEFGWEGPPYSPIQFAKYFNIDVIPNDSIIDARIIPKENNFQIQYNPFQKPTRQNFSIAHEIAHTLFSDCADTIRNREEAPWENRELEQLCNAAAAEIQLPYAIFSNDANQASSSIDGLIELATKYKASLESVFIRYTEVIDKPCLILIGIFNTDTKITIDYYKVSKSSNIKIPVNLEIPSDSKAYECISPGWTSRETVNWNFLGETYELSAVGISPYRRDTKPRVGILMFPTKHVNSSPELRKIILEYGDATKPRGTGKKIIAQIVNTSGSLGRGFGYSLSKNYPKIKEELKNWHADKKSFVLGSSQLVEINSNLFIFQMLAQKGLYPKGDEIPLKYNDLQSCLTELRKTAIRLKCSIHMPAIGAGQAKGDWNIIIGMIHDELVNYGIKVNIYLFPGAPFNPKHKSNLTIFKEDSTWEKGKLF
jgi:hypothetical protein